MLCSLNISSIRTVHLAGSADNCAARGQIRYLDEKRKRNGTVDARLGEFASKDSYSEEFGKFFSHEPRCHGTNLTNGVDTPIASIEALSLTSH